MDFFHLYLTKGVMVISIYSVEVSWLLIPPNSVNSVLIQGGEHPKMAVYVCNKANVDNLVLNQLVSALYGTRCYLGQAFDPDRFSFISLSMCP